MGKKRQPPRWVPPAPSGPPAAYKAERILGPDGVVEWFDDALSDDDAISRLRDDEKDIVVRGSEKAVTKTKAQQLMEAAFGGCEEDPHHGGKMSLPHFHPPGRNPAELHAFYEVYPRHARERK